MRLFGLRLPNPIMFFRTRNAKRRILSSLGKHFASDKTAFRYYRTEAIRTLFKNNPKILHEIVHHKLPPEQVAEVLARAERGTTTEEHLANINALMSNK